MPKVLDYPRASLARSLELATAVEESGGTATLAGLAERIGMRPGGAYSAVVSAAVKFGLVTMRDGQLRSEPRARHLRLAYDALERRQLLEDAIRSVPLFAQLLLRFAGRTVPTEHLPNLLAREFGVPERASKGVARSFVDSVRVAGLLHGLELRAGESHPDVSPARTGAVAQSRASAAASGHVPGRGGPEPGKGAEASPPPAGKQPLAGYRLTLAGPNLDTTLEISDAADLELARALLGKVARALGVSKPPE